MNISGLSYIYIHICSNLEPCWLPIKGHIIKSYLVHFSASCYTSRTVASVAAVFWFQRSDLRWTDPKTNEGSPGLRSPSFRGRRGFIANVGFTKRMWNFLVKIEPYIDNIYIYMDAFNQPQACVGTHDILQFVSKEQHLEEL